MPLGRAYYVRGVQVAFPHGERLVSGPFDAFLDAQGERVRLVPLYPDAVLGVVPHSANPLPVVVPRAAPGDAVPSHDLSTVDGRRICASAIARRVRELGLSARIEDWDGEPDVDCETPSLRAMIGLAWHPQAPMPLIHWVAADGFYLRASLPGAWRDGPQNTGARKRTSEPATWPALYEALEIGLLASIDGSAFES